MPLNMKDATSDAIRERMEQEYFLRKIPGSFDLRTASSLRYGNAGYKHTTVQKMLEHDPKEFALFYPFQHEQAAQSKQAKKDFENGASIENIRTQIHEALTITQMSVQGYEGKPLIGYEMQLLHTLALTYEKDHDPEIAIGILKNVLDSADKYPPDSMTHEKQIMPIMLSLAKCQAKSNPQIGIKTIDNGISIATKRSAGRHCVDFLHTKVNLLISEREVAQSKALFPQIYAGYLVLGNVEDAAALRSLYQKHFGTDLDPYGMRHAIVQNPTAGNRVVLDHSGVSSLGELFLIFSPKTSLQRKDVYAGICTSQYLSKLEKGTLKEPNVFVVTALAQRLGRDLDNYYTLKAEKDIFEIWELMDKVWLLIRSGKYEQVSPLLDMMGTLNDRQRHPCKLVKQFIALHTATVYNANHRNCPQYLRQLKAALTMTIPSFDELNMSVRPLTINEAALIGRIARYYEAANKIPRALDIFEKLLASIDTYWIDTALKFTMYTSIAFNYSSCLGRAGFVDEALEVIDFALNAEGANSDLEMMFELYYNKAYALYEQGCKEESLPLFLLSYYGSSMYENFSTAEGVEIAKQTIKEFFGLEL